MSGLSDLFDFKAFEGKKILDAIRKKPSRLLTGVDPGSTKVWNAVKGSDDAPLVDQWGGTTQETMDAADRAGIDTRIGRGAEGLAHVVAATYAGGYGADKVGLLGGSAPSATNATNPALIESAVGTEGYGASSAGVGGASSGLSSLDFNQLGRSLGRIGDDRPPPMDVTKVDLAALAALSAQDAQDKQQIALSSRRAKTPGGRSDDPIRRGLANADPIDANGVQIAAIQALSKRADALHKRLQALRSKNKGK